MFHIISVKTDRILKHRIYEKVILIFLSDAHINLVDNYRLNFIFLITGNYVMYSIIFYFRI